MTVAAHERAAVRRGSRWNDPGLRAIVYQAVLLAVVVGVGWYLVTNLVHNRESRGISTGFGWLDQQAGFAIGESAIAYAPSDTYARAFLVGVLNTLEVSVLGIVVATILGTLIGIARLSSNWLVAQVAAGYVELIRNIPLAVQLLIWAGLIRFLAPPPRQALEPIPGVFISNRGIQMPAPVADPAFLAAGVGLLVGIALAFVVRRWARRRQDRTGRQFPSGRAAALLVVGVPLLAWLAFGAPVLLEVPQLKGFNFQGGATLSPEFAALLVGLSIYTASFIAEIVRAGILSVSWGQTEASRALGLREGVVLRRIILPQALRVIVPPTTSQYLNLTKNSSLATIIGYPDIVAIGNTAMNQTGRSVEAIAIFMAVYLSISLAISVAMNLYNRAIALRER
jgi:general L-amino acid transport system permease protein